MKFDKSRMKVLEAFVHRVSKLPMASPGMNFSNILSHYQAIQKQATYLALTNTNRFHGIRFFYLRYTGPINIKGWVKSYPLWDRRLYKVVNKEVVNMPVVCVATSPYTDNQNHKWIRYAISIWNPLDTFSRERQRDIALGRLDIGKYRGAILLEGDNIKVRIMNQIAQSAREGTLLQAAVKQWLSNKCTETSTERSRIAPEKEEKKDGVEVAKSSTDTLPS